MASDLSTRLCAFMAAYPGPRAEHELLIEAAGAVRALAQLLDVCDRMEAEHHGQPTHASEPEYQAALAAAREALGSS